MVRIAKAMSTLVGTAAFPVIMNVEKGFEHMGNEFKVETGEMKEILNEIKDNFIQEQEETNSLLKQLISI